MNFTDKPVGKGESFAKPLKPMLQSGHVVGYLHHVVNGHAFGSLELVA